MSLVRVLVAIEPQMYREVLAFHIRQERPRSDVVLASLETLEAEAEQTRPHLIVANEVPPVLKATVGSFFWVEVHMNNPLVATISTNGHSTTIPDVSLQDLLAVVDKAEEQFAHEQ